MFQGWGKGALGGRFPGGRAARAVVAAAAARPASAAAAGASGKSSGNAAAPWASAAHRHLQQKSVYVSSSLAFFLCLPFTLQPWRTHAKHSPAVAADAFQKSCWASAACCDVAFIWNPLGQQSALLKCYSLLQIKSSCRLHACP